MTTSLSTQEREKENFLEESKSIASQVARKFAADPYVFHAYQKWDEFTEKEKLRFVRFSVQQIAQSLDIAVPVVYPFYATAEDRAGNKISNWAYRCAKRAGRPEDGSMVLETSNMNSIKTFIFVVPILRVNKNPLVLSDYWDVVDICWHELFHWRQINVGAHRTPAPDSVREQINQDRTHYVNGMLGGFGSYKMQYIEKDACGASTAALRTMKQEFKWTEKSGAADYTPSRPKQVALMARDGLARGRAAFWARAAHIGGTYSIADGPV